VLTLAILLVRKDLVCMARVHLGGSLSDSEFRIRRSCAVQQFSILWLRPGLTVVVTATTNNSRGTVCTPAACSGDCSGVFAAKDRVGESLRLRDAVSGRRPLLLFPAHDVRDPLCRCMVTGTQRAAQLAEEEEERDAPEREALSLRHHYGTTRLWHRKLVVHSGPDACPRM
jgi:hypothetical protein